MPPEAPQPPHDLDAEESVLGAMLISQKAVETCMDILEGREFYRSSHGEIYRAIVELYNRSESVDAITVANELTRTERLTSAGGQERIHELASMVPSTSNVKHWAEIVRETWLARGMIRAGQDIARLGYERTGPIDELIGEADARVIELQGFLERKRDSVFTAKQLVDEFRAKLANPEDERAGVASPFHWLAPLRGGRLYVLGGYQADGKTALSLQFLRAAAEDKARVGFMSIEMGRQDLTDRLVSTFGIPYSQVRTGHVSTEYQNRLDEALTKISGWDVEVIDDEAVDPSVVRRTQRRGKYDFLIIDHLHRIPIRNPRHAREELEESVRKITNVAREFEVPVLLLAQLSRGDFRDPFPRPTMSSLRGSGMIEAEASCVWFIWRKRDKQHTPGTDAEFVIAKNRHGPLGYQNLHFRASQVWFAGAAE